MIGDGKVVLKSKWRQEFGNQMTATWILREGGGLARPTTRSHLRRRRETLRKEEGSVSVVVAVRLRDHHRRHPRQIPPRHRPKEGGEAGDLVGGVPTMNLPGDDETEVGGVPTTSPLGNVEIGEIRRTVPGVGTNRMEAIDREDDRGK